MRNFRRLIAVVIAAALAPVALLAQEAATITGRVTNAQGQPEAAVNVQITALQSGATTDASGNYRLVVPGSRIRAGQQVTIVASRQGLASQSRTITLNPGANLTQNFQLNTSVLALEAVVVTGVAGATERAKVPFEVAQLTAADMPVPPTSAASAIQGKVAGAQVVSGSGRPGSAPSILLRGPQSISADGRSQEPLYIVDGVILGSSMVDLDALDIENIEVVKGAAAASLYGSRAAAGVVQITTKRGKGLPNDEVRYTARTEYGRNQIAFYPPELLTELHPFAMNADSTQFLDNSGNACDWLECPSVALAGQTRGAAAANQWNTFMTNRWPGQTLNQVEEFFRSGVFTQNYLAAEGRAGGTNYHVSYINMKESGVLPGLEGFDRNNFRVNLDQAVRNDISLSASAFYSRSSQDNFPENSGNPIFDLTRMPAGVNLFACEDNVDEECRDNPRNIIFQPDPTNTESANPIYDLLNREYIQKRGRFLGAATLRYSPLSWLDFDGNVSYDRLDQEETDYFFKGYQTLPANPAINEGYMDRLNALTEAFNTSITASMRFSLGNNVYNRTQLRYLYEEQDGLATFTSGSDFSVVDIPQFDVLNHELLGASSARTEVRSDGYFAITNFEIADRYILDGLIRNDGSSLFGEDERRQWYYRAAAAWRVTEEPWFRVPSLNELKFSYAYGTAGNRPNFYAQYETFAVSATGITPVRLGNQQLKPEFAREQELSMDASMFGDRIGLEVTYANRVTEDQILAVPLPAYTGYVEQYQNAGTLESNTWEAGLTARLVERGNFSWNARLLYDRTRTKITKLDVPAFTAGVDGQALDDVFYIREGEEMGTFYGFKIAESCEELPEATLAAHPCSEFAVNDDGYLVWVGTGGSLGTPSWGTAGGFTINNQQVNWGAPFAGQCTDRATEERTFFCPVGRTTPDYNLSLSNTFNWGGLTVYGLIDAVQGFSVYNQPLQWAVFKRTTGVFDQRDVAANERKPLGYYDALYSFSSGLEPSSVFVEDASFVKLRELSLRYRFGADRLASLPGNLDGLTLSLTGRNLKTWTDYRGFDPEVGKAGGDLGSAALARVEGYQYPNFRTWTLGVEVNF
ncbi:MAG TPA: SusC/RagA family TonB-linked outer membrane protein [Longimicrobium sp.]|nr:SusC/RagA family TonB-linked outer membrane protein [Longimicrobium sp.]